MAPARGEVTGAAKDWNGTPVPRRRRLKVKFSFPDSFLFLSLSLGVGTFHRSSAGRVGEAAEGESGRKVWLLLSPSDLVGGVGTVELRRTSWRCLDGCQLCCVGGCLVSVFMTVLLCARTHARQLWFARCVCLAAHKAFRNGGRVYVSVCVCVCHQWFIPCWFTRGSE